MKHFVKQVVFCLFVWCLILLIAEGLFRVVKPDYIPLQEVTQQRVATLFPPNDQFRCVSSVEGEFDVEANINAFGYRGKEFLMPKPSGITRVFAVGDSFTFGVGAEDNETIPAVLADRLRENGYALEVVNGGVGHDSPITHYVHLRDLHLQYKPDAVVLFFDMTDLWDDWHSERTAVFDKDGEILRFDPTYWNGKRNVWRTCLKYSALCRYFNNKVCRTVQKIQVLGFWSYVGCKLQGKRAKATIANSNDSDCASSAIEYDGLLMMRGRAKEEQIREHWERSKKYLLQIKSLLASRNVPLLIVMYPHGLYVDGQWEKGRIPWGFEEGKTETDYFPFELMSEFTEVNNIPFVNVLDNFLTAEPGTYFYDNDGHMTPIGYRLVAESLTQNDDFIDFIQGACASSTEL